jgi:hypothetical protein
MAIKQPRATVGGSPEPRTSRGRFSRSSARPIAPAAAPGAERVVDWPRITAVVRPDATGALTINGTERACSAGSVDALRKGISARCVSLALTLGRPVPMSVTEDGQTWALVVRPEGIVQMRNANGTVDPPTGLLVDESRCRACRHLELITVTTCTQCQVPEPHRVETTPLEIEDVLPPADDVTDLELTVARRPVASRPTLHLTFSDGSAPVTTSANVAIGRNPTGLGKRQAIHLKSPERLLSKTHLLIDVDAQGQILLTDDNSANGTQAQTEPPVDLPPGRPFVVHPGTTFLLGDVTCTVDLA